MGWGGEGEGNREWEESYKVLYGLCFFDFACLTNKQSLDMSHFCLIVTQEEMKRMTFPVYFISS